MDDEVTTESGFSILDSLSGIWDGIEAGLPTILAGLAILIIGWLVARLIRLILRKILKAAKFDSITEKMNLNQMFSKFNFELKPSAIIIKFAYWIIMLIVIISTAEAWGLEVVSAQIAQLISYMPKLLLALVILVLGLIGADFIRRTISTATKSIGVSGSKVIANIVFYIILVFVGITALNQAGVDTTLITSNITIILGSVLLAFAVAYGFAAREILTNILSSYYGKDRFREGQRVRINDVEGEILKIDSISITLQTEKSKVVIPCRKLVSEQIEILDED